MFKIAKAPEPRTIDMLIEDLVSEMRSTDPDSDRYKVLAERLWTICDAKSKTQSDHRLLIAGLNITANLVIALAVLKHEEMNVISTKLFGFLAKPRIEN